MEEYINVNVTSYVNEGITSGWMKPIVAEKFTRIMARKGTVGEVVTTWSQDAAGNPVKEKVSTVELDKQTNEPGWVVTKLDESNNVLVDQNNNINSWIIDDSTFKKKYELENLNIYKPTGGLQVFVEINDNIILEQWGSLMKIAKGGYINITNPLDMYGISKQDFLDTYKVIDREEVRK